MGRFFGVTQIDDVKRVFPSIADGEISPEQDLLDSVARESIRLSGDFVNLHVLNISSNYDPVYGEPEGESWDFPEVFTFPAGVEFNRPDDITTEANERGNRMERQAILWVARRELEVVEAPEPKPGDVVEFWGYAPFGDDRHHSYWDVVSADPSGEHFTMPTFTMLKFNLRWRERYLAERKDR